MSYKNILSILSEKTRSYRNQRTDIALLLENNYNNDKHFPINYPMPEYVASTIAISISPNGETIASSHGDHTIKVFHYKTGKLICNFTGHPRTPWTVKYHPFDSNIVASGCLGYEVRIWHIGLNKCINIQRYDSSIITLAFHPSGQYLSVASGSVIRIWNWIELVNENDLIKMNYEVLNQQTICRHIRHTRTIRALLFHPNGDFVFIAAPDTPRSNSNQQLTTCRLYLLKFNDVFVDNLFHPPIDLNNLPSILSQIHLYSDGGIDISKDGNYILTCALLLTPPQSNFIVPSNNSIRNKPDSNNQSFRPIKPPNIANRLTPLTLSLNNTNLPDVHLDKSDEMIELPPPIANFHETNTNINNYIPTVIDSTMIRQPLGWKYEECICIFDISYHTTDISITTDKSLDLRSDSPTTILSLSPKNVDIRPKLIKYKTLTYDLLKSITSTKFSSTNNNVLIGYGVRNRYGVVSDHIEKYVACEVLDTSAELMTTSMILNDLEDEVNIAMFHPFPGYGIIYGTKKGKVKAFIR